MVVRNWSLGRKKVDSNFFLSSGLRTIPSEMSVCFCKKRSLLEIFFVTFLIIFFHISLNTLSMLLSSPCAPHSISLRDAGTLVESTDLEMYLLKLFIYCILTILLVKSKNFRTKKCTNVNVPRVLYIHCEEFKSKTKLQAQTIEKKDGTCKLIVERGKRK